MTTPGEKVRFGDRTVGADEKERLVQDQFTRIARSYDRANTLFSLGLQRPWKRTAIRRLGLRPGESVLDVCGGTGDLAVLAARRVGPGAAAIVCDLNEPMMAAGRRKAGAAERRGHRITFVRGNAERLPFPDASFDAAAVGFGLRNLVDLDRGLREIARVLRPGGRFVALEFSLPRPRWLRILYDLYSRAVLVPASRFIAGADGPYRYLVESIRVFAATADISGDLAAAGFADIAVRPLTCGIATVYSGKRP
jgi:demethylmenaquinone methyltransferase/2-methoxy-6-polyprenyl-1,4-benzoquinol methylase